MNNDLIYRLRKRAEIRRNITTRKSVQEGKPDRIAELLEEAAQALYDQESIIGEMDDIIDRLERRPIHVDERIDKRLQDHDDY